MSPRKWRFRLEDMVGSATKIIGYVDGIGFQDFVRDEKTFDAVIRQLTILGEAASHVPEKIIDSAPEIPWFEIRGMRNIVVHEYFGINMKVVWVTAKKNIPELLPMLERLLQHLQKDGKQSDF